jgi:hypothetical protein
MKFWADENFNGRILKGILAVYPELDIIRVQDTPLMGLSDPELIIEAYQAGAILLTHDVKTLVPIAETYLQAGNAIAGVISIAQSVAIGTAIESITTLIGASTSADDFRNLVIRL